MELPLQDPALPGYTLREARSRDDMDAIVEVIWQTRFRPYLPSSAITFPVFGYTAADGERGLRESKERTWAAHQQNVALMGKHDMEAKLAAAIGKSKESGDPVAPPTLPSHQRWIYVVEDGTGKTVGCGRFDYHAGSPFPNGVPKLDFPFWPEGEARLCGQEMFQQILTPRSMWMQRPHGGFGMTAVLPRYRRRGIGSLMLRWVVDRLDRLSVEGYIEASDEGRPLYEKGGFVAVMKLAFFIPSGKPDEWQRWAHELMPQPWTAMWRPAGGSTVEGGRTRPWQLGPTIPV